MQNAKGLWDLNHEELKLHSCDKILINQLKHKPSIILLFFCRNLEHNNSLECAVTIIVSFLIFFFISFVFGFFFFKLGKRQHQMGAHYIMVEYYSGTKSSHLLVMMHIHTKASEHPWLHTSHCGSSMARCVPHFPPWERRTVAQEEGRKSYCYWGGFFGCVWFLLCVFVGFFWCVLFLWVLLLFVAAFFFFPSSLFLCHLIIFLFSFPFLGTRLVWFQCQNHKKFTDLSAKWPEFCVGET